MTDAAIFDESIYATLREEVADDALWQTLLEAFRDELGWRTEAILKSAAGQDLTQVEINAHGLKSLAVTYGFVALADAARSLEAAARDEAGFSEAMQAYEAAVAQAKERAATLT